MHGGCCAFRAAAHLEAHCEQRWDLVLGQVLLFHDELQRREQLREHDQDVAQRRVSGDRQVMRVGLSILRWCPSGRLQPVPLVIMC